MDAHSTIIRQEATDSALSESAVSLFWLLLATAATLFYLYRKQQQTQFSKMRLPMVTNCNFLLGHLADYARTPIHTLYRQWTKKYGKTFMYFEGPTPIVVTSDLEMLKDVFIKQFQNFNYRKDMPLVPDYHQHPYVHSFIANGARWKRLRQCSSAFFTTGRLRNLQNVINTHAKELADQISMETGVTDIDSLVSREIYDLQQEVVLGQHEGSLRNRESVPPALKLMKDCLDPSKVPVAAILGLVFPEIKSVWYGLYHLLNKFNLQKLPGYELFYHVKREVPKRLNTFQVGASRNPNMLEFLSKLVTDWHETPLRQATSRPALTYSEMVSELFVSFFTQQTFNLTFCMCLHLLAKHPHVQRQLQHEVDRTFPCEGETDENNNEVTPGESVLDYDKVSEMQYLDSVVNEVFRMYPVFQVIHRRCTKATRIGDLEIPAGVNVQPDVWSIHYDPEIWGDDAEAFNPDRFASEKVAKRNPLAMLTFGAGPRMCLGRRFVLLHMKTLLCVLLQRFTVLPHPTGDGLNCMPLEMDTDDLDMIVPKQKIFVQFVQRECQLSC